MTGGALGVGDDDTIGIGAEHVAQCEDLGRGAAASRWGVGLVRDEHRFGGDLGAAHPVGLGLADHLLHHAADVIDVEAGAVERAVGRDGTEHLADRLDATLAGGLSRFDHDRRGTHAEDHSVAPLVERQCRRGDVVVGGGGARGQEPGTQPAEQLVARHVVGGDDDHSAAPTLLDPVLGHSDRLRGARTGSVHLGVRTAGADDVGELRVTHRQDAEEEPTVELVRVCGEFVLDVADAAVDLGERSVGCVGLADPGADGTQLVELETAGVVALEPADLVDQLVEARERRCEDDAGVVAECVGQAPSIGQLAADVSGAVSLDERQSGVAECVDAGCDRELRGAAKSGHPLGFDTELGGQIELAGAGSELDDVGDAVDGLEGRSAGVALGQPDDVLVGDLGAEPARDHVDELLTVEESGEVAVVEEALGARRAQRSARDDHGGVVTRAATAVGDQRTGLTQEVGEQRVEIGRHGRILSDECHRCGRRSGDGGGRCTRLVGEAGAMAGRVQPAQRLVEGDDVGLLGVVGEQHGDVVAEHIGSEAVEGSLGAGLDEHASTEAVEGVQTVDELHGRCHLAGQEVEDLVGDLGSGGIQLAGHVRDDRTHG